MSLGSLMRVAAKFDGWDRSESLAAIECSHIYFISPQEYLNDYGDEEARKIGAEVRRGGLLLQVVVARS